MLKQENQLIFQLLLALLIILHTLFLYLLFQKIIENKRNEQIEHYKEKSRDRMFHYLYRGEKSRFLLPENRIKYSALEELLSDFASVLEGEQAEENISSFAVDHFTETYKAELFHKRWSIRMNTLFMIEAFKMKNLLPDIINLYESKAVTKAEESQILKLLAIFHYQGLITYLLKPKNSLSEFTFRSIYSHMSDEGLLEIGKRFDSLPRILQVTFIDVIGIKNLINYNGFLMKKLINKDSEVRIRTLKAIAELGIQISFELIEQHLKSTSWQERMMAAKVCGRIRGEGCLIHLQVLIEDRHYSVRSQAAQSILQFGNGKKILKDIIEHSKDPYAKDMAFEWIERGSIYDSNY